MRIKEIKVYKYDELPDKAKEKARDWYRDAAAADNYILDEMMASLKALFNRAGIKLTDWGVGAYSRHSYVKFDMGDAGELKGARAVAWLENNLFAQFRITWAQFDEKRRDYLSYGDGYRVGKIKPCPLTGMCYDEDLFDALRKSVKDGDNLRDAFAGLADVVQRINEREIEYQNEGAQVEESIIANGYEFDENGDII